MVNDTEIVRKAEAILAKFPAVRASWTKGERMSGYFTDKIALGALSIEVTNLANLIYGEGSSNANRITEQIRGSSKSHLDAAEGMLRGTISSIQDGLIADLRTQVLLDVQEDFIEAARVALSGGKTGVRVHFLLNYHNNKKGVGFIFLHAKEVRSLTLDKWSWHEECVDRCCDDVAGRMCGADKTGPSAVA